MPTPEGQVLSAILQFLAAKHVLAFRMNTLAMPTADGKRFIKAGVKGMADVLAFPPNKPVLWIEAKAPKGVQSEFQSSFQERVEAEGHSYVLARCIEDVERFL